MKICYGILENAEYIYMNTILYICDKNGKNSSIN